MGGRILILGAGVGGLSAADRLRDLLPDDHRVTVVDPAADRVLGLSHLWVMRGWREPDEVRFVPSVIEQRGVEVIPATVDEILLDGRVVRAAGRELWYDALVVAMGAQLAPELLPGLSEAIGEGVAGEFYSLDGAVSLRERLAEFRGGRLCVLVSRIPFKCPAAPYEGAFLLDDLFAENGVRDAVQIDIYTPEPHPMPVAGPAVGAELVSLLQQRRIGFHSGTTVERVDPRSRELVFESGERESFDFLVAVPPHKPPRPVAAAGFGPQGWIPVDERTLTTPADRVWALGDVAQLKLANGLPLPKAAVFALGQAEAVANGIARKFGHDAPRPWFSGDGYCWIELGGGLAAKGVGSFLDASGPVVELYGPSAEHHLEKEEEERDWRLQWTELEDKEIDNRQKPANAHP